MASRRVDVVCRLAASRIRDKTHLFPPPSSSRRRRPTRSIDLVLEPPRRRLRRLRLAYVAQQPRVISVHFRLTVVVGGQHHQFHHHRRPRRRRRRRRPDQNGAERETVDAAPPDAPPDEHKGVPVAVGLWRHIPLSFRPPANAAIRAHGMAVDRLPAPFTLNDDVPGQPFPSYVFPGRVDEISTTWPALSQLAYLARGSGAAAGLNNMSPQRRRPFLPTMRTIVLTQRN